jgi:hypothetical protein
MVHNLRNVFVVLGGLAAIMMYTGFHRSEMTFFFGGSNAREKEEERTATAESTNKRRRLQEQQQVESATAFQNLLSMRDHPFKNLLALRLKQQKQSENEEPQKVSLFQKVMAMRSKQQQQQSQQPEELEPAVPELRIVGGTPVAVGEYPFFAWTAGSTLCGATLIHEDILLTAAVSLTSRLQAL